MLRTVLPLRHRDYRLLWIGQAISHVGNGISQVALAWQALELSSSAGALSAVLAARTIPLLLLLLVGGAVSDRLPRRRVMLISDAIRGVSVCAMAVLALTDTMQLWHLVGLAAIFGAGDAFFFPAVGAFIPELVPPDDLVNANSLEGATRPLAMRLAGPALGGVLVAGFGTGVAFVFDAATFAVSAACLFAIRARTAPPRLEPSSVVRDIVEGFRFVRSQAWLWATLLMALGAVLFFVGPHDVLMPKLSKQRFGGAGAYGMLAASMGAGGIIGAFVAPSVARGRRLTRMYVIWGVSIMMFSGVALAGSLPVAVLLIAALGFGFEIGHIIWTTLLQELVPAHLLGRVRSLDFTVSLAFQPLSLIIVAPVAASIGITTTIFWSGLIAGAITFAFMLYPGVLDVDRPRATPAADPLVAPTEA